MGIQLENMLKSLFGNYYKEMLKPEYKDYSFEKMFNEKMGDVNTIEVIEPKEDKFSRYLIKTYFRSHLQYFRKEWNSICSSYKFSINDKGEYICA